MGIIYLNVESLMIFDFLYFCVVTSYKEEKSIINYS